MKQFSYFILYKVNKLTFPLSAVQILFTEFEKTEIWAKEVSRAFLKKYAIFLKFNVYDHYSEGGKIRSCIA